MSSVFLVTTRGSGHHPRGEGDEMAKSRDPTFTLTFSRKYSPSWRAWEGSEECFTAAKRTGKCYKRASELNNRAQCKNAIKFSFFVFVFCFVFVLLLFFCVIHMFKKGLTARAPKTKKICRWV